MAKGKIIIELNDEGTIVDIDIKTAQIGEVLGAYRHTTQSFAQILNSKKPSDIPEISAKKQIISLLHMACTDGIDEWIDEESGEEESEKHES